MLSDRGRRSFLAGQPGPRRRQALGGGNPLLRAAPGACGIGISEPGPRLAETGRQTDTAAHESFTAIWDQPDRPVLDRVAGAFALGHAEAARLLVAARDPVAAAPKEVSALLTDPTSPAFFRANLGLAYAKALSNRRVYEEALEVLQTVKPEQVVDPAAYFFHKAVAEHALMRKAEAAKTIARLLEDVVDVP